jgi:hypothetical protein
VRANNHASTQRLLGMLDLLLQFFVGVGEGAVGAARTASPQRQVAAHADLVFGVRGVRRVLELPAAVLVDELH